ncbi:MAG: 3-phosphoshikimate 1-carboxyvinyltransferase [Gammaproteobacteria bacterium]|nr:3-phosphoshikimate 1-carboxyvinyltransferase [Gammaproteobacteria bacterium]
MQNLIVQAGNEAFAKWRGRVRVPGDKSVSHRSIMLGALAEGTTHVSGFLQGEDSLNTLRAFRAMGVQITDPVDGCLTIRGVGLHGLSAPASDVYLGNSGTSMRLLAGILAGQKFSSVLTGDSSLAKRPMRRVIEPLQVMGAHIDSVDGKPPLRIKGNALLSGIDYVMPMASAQVKSCVLLAGLYAQNITAVTEPAPTRDHTERMLHAFGYAITRSANRVSLQGQGRLIATTIEVPGDISSAAFFMVAAAITPGADILIERVGLNPTRTGVIDILRLMGADITVLDETLLSGEPVGTLRVRGSELVGIDIPTHLVPLAIDEFPAIFIAAACAQGVTRLTDAEELRVKESDRIQVMADGLRVLGINAEPTADGIVIEGGAFGGGEINSHGDHRIAMSFAMAALRAQGSIHILDCENINTSFPGFVPLVQGCGLQVSVA